MQKLLDDIFAIVERDRLELAERTERGEMFNVFDVLGWQKDEVRTHSSFIAGLLDPNGKHSCGDKFLQAFIDITECNDLKLDIKFAKVSTEVNAGSINRRGTEGGRLDILVESRNKAILIENKIYAEDQSKQLLRYYNYAIKKYQNDFRLFYLTLDGHPASQDSATDEVDYWPISYRDDIVQWLIECEKIAEGKPVVQYVIRQYRNLIKELTNKMNNDTNENELMDLLCCKENAQKTAAIIQRHKEIKERLIEDFLISKLNKWAARRGMEVMEPEKNWWFRYRPKNWQNHFVGLERKDKNHYLQIYRDGGRVHKKISLNSLPERRADNWPFGYLNCREYIVDMEDVTTGKSFEEVKKLIMSIMNEIKQLSNDDGWTIVM